MTDAPSQPKPPVETVLEVDGADEIEQAATEEAIAPETPVEGLPLEADEADVEPAADPGDSSLPVEDQDALKDPLEDPLEDPESNSVEPFAPDDPEEV